MSHRERGCLKRTHGGPGGGEEKIAFVRGRKREGRGEKVGETEEGNHTPACDPKTLAMRSSVKSECRIFLEKRDSTAFFLPGIECRMNSTNTSTTRWSAASDTWSIA